MSRISTKFIADNAVTYAKVQQASTLTLLGNPTGSPANVSEITLGTNLSFSGSVLNATGGGGNSPANIQSATSTGQTYTSSSASIQICNATSARTDTLPSTITSGTILTFYNKNTGGTNIITLQTSGSNIVSYILPQGYLQLVALSATPTTAADWQILEVTSSWNATYTPSFSAGFGTVTSATANFKMTKDSVFVRGSGISGTSAASIASISIPSIFTINPNNLSLGASTTANNCNILGTLGSAGSTLMMNILAAPNTSTSNVYVSNSFSSGNPISPATAATFIITNSNYFSFYFEFPI